MRQEKTEIDELLGMCEQPPQADTDAIVRKTMKRIAARRRSRIVMSTISAAVSAAAVILVAVFLYPDTGSPVPGIPAKDLNTFEVPAGAIAILHLPDGSLAKINAGSKVIYPESFNGRERRIFVDGEVYLDVFHDKARPFIVSADEFEVKVHGTKFNIDTRHSGHENVVLAEGSVEVSVSGGNGVMLSPGQMASLNGKLISVSEVRTEDYICWAKGYINLNGETIDKVSARLSEYYGIPIRCNDTDSRLYGKLEFKDTLGEVLESISRIVKVNVSYSPSEGYIIDKEN